jgi:hypothetical protein
MPIMFRTALISMFLTSTALATTWTVDDDGKADFDNIQAAIDAASDGDEIVVMPGTYTSTADEVVDMLGKEIWLHSSGGADVTIIDGEGTRRGILCDSGETTSTVIEGFTVQNCSATWYDWNGDGQTDFWEQPGGGMWNRNGSSSTLTDCTFENNEAYFGGGMLNSDNSSPTLTNCTFDSNTANYFGGGMYNSSSNPTLTDCTFTGNRSPKGGGMCNGSSSPTLTNCIFDDNQDLQGGGGGGGSVCGWDGDGGLGMYNSISSPTLTNCTFRNHSAGWSGHGGAMANIFGSSPTLESCTFTGNISGNIGGGMYNYFNSNPTLTDCTFENNATSQDVYDGGGMYNACSSPTLEGCTFTGNTAKSGGGMYNSSSNPTLTDTTVCGNSPDQIDGYFINGGGNIIANECPSECPDINDDGYVNVSDLLAIIDQWGLTNSPADVNDDGIVDVTDLLIVVGNWGECE